MALHSVNLRCRDAEVKLRRDAAILGGRYLLSLQYGNAQDKENFGGLAEHVPGDKYSYPRDAATGGMGLCALYRMTGEKKYVEAAIRFAEWYRKYASDKSGWPYMSFDFEEKAGTNLLAPDATEKDKKPVEAPKSDWQAGGALFYYYLSAVTGKRKYVEDCMLPMLSHIMKAAKQGNRKASPGGVTLSNSPADFLLIALLSAFVATKNEEYLRVARTIIEGFPKIMDPQTGLFPGGTFVGAISMLVLNHLDEHLGQKPNQELVEALELVAHTGLSLQACDYNEPRVHGGFWGQSPFDIGRHTIHQRSTGYAAIFYMMLLGNADIPYYHCLHWNIPKK
jgi:uncharacterized protein YyaL (SSP411 family)